MGLLRQSLDLLYLNYNRRERDDVLIFHEGDFTVEDQANLIASRTEIRFVLLPDRYWHVPVAVSMDNQSTWAQTRFKLGYRHMMRWYSTCIWSCMHEMGYEFVMRLDEESFIYSPIRYNLFEWMATEQRDYGFRMVSYESGFSDERFHSFLREYLQAAGISPSWLLHSCGGGRRREVSLDEFSMRECGEIYGFYNNFFISRVSFWLQPQVQAFLKHVDDSGEIYRSRWNDLILQSAVVQMFMPVERVHLFLDFTYEHATRGSLGNRSNCVVFGGMAQGENDASGFRRARNFLSEFCSAPCWRTYIKDRQLVATATAGLVVIEQFRCDAWPPPYYCKQPWRRSGDHCQLSSEATPRCREIVQYMKRHPFRRDSRSGAQFYCDASIQQYLAKCRGECPRIPDYQGKEEFDCRYRLHLSTAARGIEGHEVDELAAKFGLPWLQSARDLAGVRSGFSRKETRQHQCESIANVLYHSGSNVSGNASAQ